MTRISSSDGTESIEITYNDDGNETIRIDCDSSIGIGGSPSTPLHVSTDCSGTAPAGFTYTVSNCGTYAYLEELTEPISLNEAYVTREEYNTLAGRITTLLDRIDKIKNGKD